MIDVMNTIEEIEGKNIVNAVLDHVLIVILIIGCFLILSVFM